MAIGSSLVGPLYQAEKIGRPAIVLYAACNIGNIGMFVYIGIILFNPRFNRLSEVVERKRFPNKGPFQSIECLFKVNEE